MNLLFCSSTSACFELETGGIYYSKQKYNVYVNGRDAGVFDTNVFSLFGLSPKTGYKIKTSLNGEELEFITAPESACIDVRAFGAAGDGIKNDSTAIQTAINVCPPGGRIYLPRGTYLVSPLTLKSDITLELAEGAVLLASPDPEEYPVIRGEIYTSPDTVTDFASWEGTPADSYQSILSLHYLNNVKIIGRGVIDGNAPESVWWINPKQQKTGRPRLFFACRCRNITVHGISCRNSPSWNYHPYFSKKINFFDIYVSADKDSPNTDGINPESCDKVNIVGVKFSVGDDCVAIKSGKMYMGSRYKTPSRNITVRNCLMEHGHGGVVLGSEMSGGIKNLSVSRCIFSRTDRGLRIKTRRGRGKYGVIDGIVFEDIIMDNVSAPLVINMFYFCDPDGKTEYVWSKQKLPVDNGTPRLGSFCFRNMKCENVEQACGFFYGLPEQPVGEIIIENVSFSIKPDAKAGTPAMMSDARVCCKEGIYANNVSSLKLNNVTFSGVEGDEIITENVGKIQKELKK